MWASGEVVPRGCLVLVVAEEERCAWLPTRAKEDEEGKQLKDKSRGFHL